MEYNLRMFVDHEGYIIYIIATLTTEKKANVYMGGCPYLPLTDHNLASLMHYFSPSWNSVLILSQGIEWIEVSTLLPFIMTTLHSLEHVKWFNV